MVRSEYEARILYTVEKGFILQSKSAHFEKIRRRATRGENLDAGCHLNISGLTFDSLRENLAWWVVTRRTSKNHRTLKIGGWVLFHIRKYGPEKDI